MTVAIKIENLSKQYRLGQVGTGTLAHDLNRWWHRARGKEDPYSQIGQINDRSMSAASDYVFALRNINFEVREGDVLGLIGANGAGKSTLLKLISRITSPTSGLIKSKGRVASLLEVGTGMHPEMTARENVYLNGAILGMSRVEITRKFHEIIDFAGCRMYVDTPIKRYSSGMKVRLGFGVAAFLEPEVLIIDEVLAVGDAAFQQRAISKMDEISKTGGRTIIFVSHNMAMIQSLCKTGIVLKHGSIAFKGTAEQAIACYLSNGKEQSVNRIAERTDREGDGSAKCTDIWLEGRTQTRGESVLSGDSVTLYLQYTLLDASGNYDFNIGIYDSFGIALAHNSSQYTTVTGRAPESLNGLIACQLPKLCLPPGQYTINTSILRNGARADRIESALSFAVEQGDFYGSGKIPAANSGKVLFDYSWGHVASDDKRLFRAHKNAPPSSS